MVELAVSELGHLDILNNCAGVRELIPFLELRFDDWQHVISINLTVLFCVARPLRVTWLARDVPAKSSTCHRRLAWSPPPIVRLMSLPSMELSA